MYQHEYKTITTSILVNITTGRKLQKTTNPNDKINDIIIQNNARAIFTDGSKSPDTYVGTATICPSLDVEISRSIDKIASIYTAECIAINDAMNTIVNNRDSNYVIFTDSLSAVISLQSTDVNTKINNYIIEIK